jgi:hypothetical protein
LQQGSFKEPIDGAILTSYTRLVGYGNNPFEFSFGFSEVISSIFLSLCLKKKVVHVNPIQLLCSLAIIKSMKFTLCWVLDDDDDDDDGDAGEEEARGSGRVPIDGKLCCPCVQRNESTR